MYSFFFKLSVAQPLHPQPLATVHVPPHTHRQTRTHIQTHPPHTHTHTRRHRHKHTHTHIHTHRKHTLTHSHTFIFVFTQIHILSSFGGPLAVSKTLHMCILRYALFHLRGKYTCVGCLMCFSCCSGRRCCHILLPQGLIYWYIFENAKSVSMFLSPTVLFSQGTNVGKHV